jgi:hypothetical protein
MNPMLTQMFPSAAAWRRTAFAAPRAEQPARARPDIVLDEAMLYRSECFAEDLQASSDAALADLFPMLRAKRAAAAGR